MKLNAFKELELEPKKHSKQALKQAYLKMIKKYPPEKDADKFKTIRKAFDILNDAATIYDFMSINPEPLLEKTIDNSILLTKLNENLIETINNEFKIDEIKENIKKEILISELTSLARQDNINEHIQ